MGLGCSCNKERIGSWRCLKNRLSRSAEVRKFTRKPIHIRPRFLMIRRRTRYTRKICCCGQKVVCCVPALPVKNQYCSKSTKGTITNSNDCQICTQNELYKACYQYGESFPKSECKYCAQEIILKSSKSCCTENQNGSCNISQKNSPEPIRNVCRFTVDAYFT